MVPFLSLWKCRNVLLPSRSPPRWVRVQAALCRVPVVLVLTDARAQGCWGHCPYPAFPAGKPSLTLLLMPPSGLRSPVALRVRKMIPDDLPNEYLQAEAYPWETQTYNTSSLSLTGAPHPTLSTARMLCALLWQQWPRLLALLRVGSQARYLCPLCAHMCECQASTWQQIGGRSQRIPNSFPGRAWMGEGTSALCQPTQFHPVPAWISQTS